MGCDFCNYSPCLCGRAAYHRAHPAAPVDNDCPSCGALLSDCRCGTLDVAPEPE